MSQHPIIAEATHIFQEKFRSAADLQFNGPRSVGLENEYLMVAANGTIIHPEILHALWDELRDCGWTLSADDVTGQITSACRLRSGAAMPRTHAYDIITTDYGYATLEIDLAPAQTLQEAERSLADLLALVTTILARYDTYLLGYGVQPVTRPDKQYLGPKSRYGLIFRVREGENSLNPGSLTVDLHCMNASCQTQVEISLEEAIPVVNALNATSGLRIALCANSPVWQNKVSEYSALRQLFWDWCWPARQEQFGMPPRFASIEQYVDYLLDFRTIAVMRDQTFFQLSGNTSFRHFLTDEQGQIGTTFAGREARIFGTAEDIKTQYAFAWLDSRLQPHYGTVEDRVSCQQPPQMHFCASALTLGLVENYHALVELADTLSRDQWRDIRLLACKHGMNFTYPGVALREYLERLVHIASRGLKMREAGEEVYLEPLYARIKTGQCPADEARAQFVDGGVEKLVQSHDMRLLLANTRTLVGNQIKSSGRGKG